MNLQLYLPLRALAPSIRSLSRQGAGWVGVCYFLGQVSLHWELAELTLSLPSPTG